MPGRKTERKRLTDRTLQSLKKANETYDVVVPNLLVRVSPKGRKTFVLYTRFPGSKNPARRSLGKYGAITLDQARQKARHWLELIDKGRDPADEVRALKIAQERKGANSFRKVCEDFFAEKLTKERKGAEVQREIEQNFLSAWNGRPITDIEPEDIAAIIKMKARTAPAQARNILVSIKRLLQWACDQHAYGIKFNPAAMLKPTALCGDKGFGKKPCWVSNRAKDDIDARMLRTLKAMARKRGDDPRKVKLEHWQNHDLRRVVRSGLSKLKVVDEVAEAVLAHSRKGIQGVYDKHDYFDEKKEALTLWAGRLRDIITPPPANVVKLDKARV